MQLGLFDCTEHPGPNVLLLNLTFFLLCQLEPTYQRVFKMWRQKSVSDREPGSLYTAAWSDLRPLALSDRQKANTQLQEGLAKPSAAL